MRTFIQTQKARHQTNSTESAALGRAHLGQSPDVKSILNSGREVSEPATQNTIEDAFAVEETQVSFPEHRDLLIPGPIQRTCVCGADEEPAVQRMPIGTRAASGHALGGVAHVIAGHGSPLPAAISDPMSDRLGIPLDYVRVYTGNMAASSAAALRSRAYTVGSNIVFGAHAYQPSTRGGQRLIAHEVAHTLQQRSGRVALKRGEVSPRNDPLETEADQFAAGMLDEGPLPAGFEPPVSDDHTSSTPRATSDGPIQRDAEEEQTASGFDEALDAIRFAGRIVPGLQPLIHAIDIIRTAYDVYQRRDEIFQQIVDGIDTHVQQIPAEARRLAQEHAATLGSQAAEAFMCVFEEMAAFLESLADNWREVIESILTDMLIVPLLERAVPSIIDNVIGIADDIEAGEYGAAVDRVVNIMTEVNSLAGVLFLWYALALTVLGTAVGTVEPGGGNAAGAAAGMTISEVLGIALLTSVIATELTRLGRGLQLMSEFWDNEEARRAACREVAEGIFGLAVAATLFFIGPYVQRFARSIITRARAAVAEATAVLRQQMNTAVAVGPGGQAVRFQGPMPETAPPIRPLSPEPATGTVRQPGRASTSPEPPVAPATAPEVAPGARIGGAVATDPLRRADDEDDDRSTPCDRLGLRGEYPRPNAYELVSEEYNVVMRGNRPNYTYKKPMSITARIRRGRGSDPSRLTRMIMQGSTRRIERPPGNFICRKIGVNTNETGGHIIGNYFKGRANDEGLAMGNIFPQEVNSNNTVYNAIEQRLQTLMGSRFACLRLTFAYGDEDYPVRPISFRVEYWVDDGRGKKAVPRTQAHKDDCHQASLQFRCRHAVKWNCNSPRKTEFTSASFSKTLPPCRLSFQTRFVSQETDVEPL